MSDKLELIFVKVGLVTDIIKELRSSGADKILVRAGLLSTKAGLYFEINEALERKEQKRTRTPVLTLIQEVADEFRVGQTTVYRAKALMRSKPEMILQSSENFDSEEEFIFDESNGKKSRNKHLRGGSKLSGRCGF